MVNSHVVRTSERSSSAPASNLMNLSRGYRHQIRMRVKLETTQVKGIFNDPFPGSKRLSDIGKSARYPHTARERYPHASTRDFCQSIFGKCDPNVAYLPPINENEFTMMHEHTDTSWTYRTYIPKEIKSSSCAREIDQ